MLKHNQNVSKQPTTVSPLTSMCFASSIVRKLCSGAARSYEREESSSTYSGTCVGHDSQILGSHNEREAVARRILRLCVKFRFRSI